MIRSLTIENFKCFSRLQVELGRLTLFTGLNSGGKSSALQPLLLLAQGLRQESYGPTKRFPLNGRFVRLGSASDVLPFDAESSLVKFSVATESESREWVLAARPGDRSLQFDSTELTRSDDQDGDTVVRSLRRLSYLGATRAGTPDEFPMPDSASRDARDVGFDGRYAAHEYHRFADDEVAIERRCPGSLGETVRKQVDHWLSWIFPGAQANVQQYSQLSLLNVQFRVSEFGEWRRPVNVGYGYSYAFPIVVSLLTAKSGQTVVVDSPEAHLHPHAQSKMGRMLAHFAESGVQLLVESHSDHILNGVRLAVKNRTVTSDTVKVLYFAGSADSSPRSMGVCRIDLDEHGGLSRWPEGFFDQIENDLSQL